MRNFLLFVLLTAVIASPIPVSAQSQSDLPVYIVQPGDTLGNIATRFGVPLNSLIEVNAISDPNAISAGMPIKIPGLEGISGTLTTQSVLLGETFTSLTTRYQLPGSLLARINRVTSPQELYAGASLVIPQEADKTLAGAFSSLLPGQSTLEVMAENNLNPWASEFLTQDLTQAKNIPGEIFFSKEIGEKNPVSNIHPYVTSVLIKPLPLIQGETTTIEITTNRPLTLSGSLAGRELQFIQKSENTYLAMQGIYALTQPGLAAFVLHGVDQKNTSFGFEEMVILKAGYYPNDPPLMVDATTIDPAVTKPEEEQIARVIAPVTTNKYWEGKFRVPVDEPVCYKSTFGNRRSYNGGPYSSFHGGTDFGVCANLNIYAPAAGVVVFAAPLTVRGNATIIDHGWGIYSGYWHQKEIKVKVGDMVEAGQLIGLIGATGRVTGPHLHWEIVVHGVQVEPVTWLEKQFP